MFPGPDGDYLRRPNSEHGWFKAAAPTLDIYADLFDDDLDTVADALDAARRRIPALAAV